MSIVYKNNIKTIFNEDGAYTDDIFYFSYYRINVFFKVGAVDEHGIYVYELKTKKRKIKNKYVDFICNNDVPSKYPFFVPVDFNTWTQTRYRLETFKEKKTTYCAVEVNKNSPIYYEAIRNGINSPMTGILVAKKMNFKRSKYSYYFNRIQPKKPEFYRA